MGMDKDRFYETPSPASLVKQVIVLKYFGGWKNVLKTWRVPILGYMDLYSGPGRYNDNTFSTPLLILQEALKDSYLCDHLAAVFNDRDRELAERLRSNIKALPGIERLKHRPVVHALTVSPELAKLRPVGPTLLFADPWGYKGLSLEMIANFLNVRGSDCIFFFNYNRINAGLNWKGFDEPLDQVFGPKRAASLRSKLSSNLTAAEREELILTELEGALMASGAHCVPRFRFSFPDSDKASHHLLFVSKSEKGCSIMKNVMRKQSSVIEQGIANFALGGSGSSAAAQPLLPGSFLVPLMS